MRRQKEDIQQMMHNHDGFWSFQRKQGQNKEHALNDA